MSDDDTRSYNSPLREQRAAETRQRIVEAAVKLLGEGAHRMTVPAVAKEAGVSVPTVYRHFASKEELESGVVEYVRQFLSRDPYDGLDGLAENVRENWAAAREYPPGTLPLLMANVARNLDAYDPSARRAHVENSLAADLEALQPEDRERFVTIVQALASSPGGIAFLRTGLDHEEAAEMLNWLLRTLYDALAER